MVGAYSTESATAAWRRYFETKKAADVPDFRRCAGNVDVNLHWSLKLKGINKGGMLHAVLKRVQQHFVRKSSFKLARIGRSQAMRQLEDFFKNASDIITEQERLRGGNTTSSSSRRRGTSSTAAGSRRNVKKRVRTARHVSSSDHHHHHLLHGGGGGDGAALTAARDALWREKTRAEIALSVATMERHKAEAAKAKVEAQMLELTTTATVMKTLGVPLEPAMENRLKRRLSALLEQTGGDGDVGGGDNDVDDDSRRDECDGGDGDDDDDGGVGDARHDGNGGAGGEDAGHGDGVEDDDDDGVGVGDDGDGSNSGGDVGGGGSRAGGGDEGGGGADELNAVRSM